MKTFEDTIIYDEALKETLRKDLDLKHTLQIFEEIRKGEIKIFKLETKGTPTPIARLGIDRVRMKTDLIPPERIKYILIESVKARLLNEVRTLLCVNCWDYSETVQVKALPNKPICPRCGSTNLGVLFEDEGQIFSLMEKKGKNLTKKEQRIRERAIKTAKLTSEYGKPAVVALSGRKLKLSDMQDIVKEKTLTDHFFELVLEAERKALKRRFW